ncbi:MAG: fasciclin domain-containing protein [Gemmatimonadota bacterium]|nr:fasciclin domain-containing protein [Gemmatimonadota bacterium]
MHRRSLLLVAVSVFGLAACSDAPTSPEADALLKRAPAPAASGGAGQADASIVGTALAVNGESGEFSTLIAALQAAGLVEAPDGRGQYTVFAPTDAAFAELDAFLQANTPLTLADVVADTELLTDVLLYHVKEGRRISNSVLPARQLDMANGDKVFVAEGGLRDAAGQSVGFVPDLIDIGATNGVIHVIDTVLLPPSVVTLLASLEG